MKQAYFKHLTRTYSATPDDYLEDEQVRPGKMLVVSRIAAWHDNIATTEAMRFYVKTGEERIWIADDTPDTTGGPAHTDLNIPVGEGAAVGAHAPSIAGTEVQHLVVVGELWEAEDWKASS